MTYPVYDLKELRGIRSPKSYYLASRMHTGIGTPRGMEGADLFATHYRKSLLKLRLYGLEIRLLLPSEEATPVVLHYELDVLHNHSFLFGTKSLSDLNSVKRRALSNVIGHDPHRQPIRDGGIRTKAPNMNIVGASHIELHRILLRGRVHDNA
jgi:hypothetical protein